MGRPALGSAQEVSMGNQGPGGFDVKPPAQVEVQDSRSFAILSSLADLLIEYQSDHRQTSTEWTKNSHLTWQSYEFRMGSQHKRPSTVSILFLFRLADLGIKVGGDDNVFGVGVAFKTLLRW